MYSRFEPIGQPDVTTEGRRGVCGEVYSEYMQGESFNQSREVLGGDVPDVASLSIRL